MSSLQYRAGPNELSVSGSFPELEVVQVLCEQTKSLFTGELDNMDISAAYEQLEFLTSGMTRAERRHRFGPLAV